MQKESILTVTDTYTMKKILIIVAVLLTVFFLLVYLSLRSTDDTFRTCEILDVSEIQNHDFRKFDSVLVAANTLYEADWVKEVMQGEQYRDAWAAPVRVPIVFLDTLLGGVKIIEEGGGMQTHSLEVEDSLGIRYTFRSISKDPSKLIPDIAHDLGLENVVVDGVSAQHPYAALVVARLSDVVGILHTNPKTYFLPKQELLGKYNDKYGDRLYLFEYESEGKVNWTKLKNSIGLLDTEDVQQLKSEGEPIAIDRPALIRARLFDLIIGDWDRHAKQWGWAIEKRDSINVAHPIAADRDNAFFKLEGVIPKIISTDILLPEVQTFENDIEHMPGLVRPFDVYFLKSATIEEFLTEAEYLQNKLTDRAIDEAFEIWPENIRELNAKEIKEKIKARRAGIVEYAKTFKSILDDRELKQIILKGSEDLELDDPLSNCFDCLE